MRSDEIRPLIVFDLDGTLVNSRRDLADSTNDMLGMYGAAPLPADEVAMMVGEGARVLVERALQACGLFPDISEALARFREIYDLRLLEHTRPYAGIPEVVRELHRTAVLAVLTNKPEDLSCAILDGLGLTRWVSLVVGGDSLPTRKPDPAGLQMLLARSRTRAAEFLLVGDSPVDFETAAQAGVAFCGVSWGLVPERLRACAPAVLIDDAAALVPLVERGLPSIAPRLP